jgi:hypothetical protein
LIHIGLSTAEKARRVSDYVVRCGAEKVVVFYPKRHPLQLELDVPTEHIEWDDVIRYVFFYRLLQEVNQRTLLVFNEILRTPERSCLTYNCLRNYLTRTEQQLVFSRFPCLESPDDFMVLVDLDTRSRWRRSRLGDVSDPINVDIVEVAPALVRSVVPTDTATRDIYARTKRKLIDGIGTKDPHTIPRQLHMLSGKHKASMAAERGGLWVGRNARLKVPGLATYDDAREPRQVLEFCHSFRDWSDYLTASGALELSSLVSDLKVDQWYFERFQRWTEMQRNACAAIRNHIGT